MWRTGVITGFERMNHIDTEIKIASHILNGPAVTNSGFSESLARTDRHINGRFSGHRHLSCKNSY
mgnify:CR=1 FL=1